MTHMSSLRLDHSLFPPFYRLQPSFWRPIIRIWLWYVIMTGTIILGAWSLYVANQNQIIRLTRMQYDLWYDAWSTRHEVQIKDGALVSDGTVWTYTPALVTPDLLTSLAGKPVHDMLRVDQNADPTQFRTYDSFLVLNKNDMLVQMAEGEVRSIPYTQLAPDGNLTINTQTVRDFIAPWKSLAYDSSIQTSLLIVVSILFFMLHPLLMIISVLISQIIYAIYMYLLGRFMGEQYKIGYLYRFGLWLAPFLVVIQEILWWIVRMRLPGVAYVAGMMILYLIFLPRKK